MSQLQGGLREEETGGEELRDPQPGVPGSGVFLLLRRQGEGGSSPPQAPPVQLPARPCWMRPSLFLGGQWVWWIALPACLPTLPTTTLEKVLDLLLLLSLFKLKKIYILSPLFLL